jgi:hypothetical protein
LNKFQYYNNSFLAEKFDNNQSIHPYLKEKDWNEQNAYVVSRVHKINCPIPLANTLCELPRDLHQVDLDFSKTIDKIADYYCQKVIAKDQYPYLFYSGGIDSVSVLVAILRNASKDFLERLTIVCNHHSFNENPYFYDRFIKNKFQLIDTDKFALDLDGFENIVIFDGEMGNQIMGSCCIYDFTRKGRYDLLADSYHLLLDSPFSDSDRYLVDLTIESLQYAPLEIHTLHDFLWWSNFNFKVDEVLLRKILVYTDGMTSQQRQSFYHNNLIRFYSHPQMQKWSIASLHLRRESLKKTTKYFPKKYIFDFDKNEIWFIQKRETPSNSQIFIDKSFYYNIFAMDTDWNLLDIRDRKTRQMIRSFYLDNFDGKNQKEII